MPKVSNKRIVTVMMGGLGNQIFQFAAGEYISITTNREHFLDVEYGEPRVDRNGNLDLINVFEGAKIEHIRGFFPKAFLKKLLNLGMRFTLQNSHRRFDSYRLAILVFIVQLIVSFTKLQKFKIFFSDNLGLPSTKIPSGNVLLVGYFQTYKYWMSDELKFRRSEIEIPDDLVIYKDLAIKDNPLIVHVRLTDYLIEKDFGIPSVDYYRNAIAFQCNKGSFNRIWVFSDDIKKAKEILPLEFSHLYVYQENPILTPVNTLLVMTLGKGFVIGNSSFAWWGAMLSSVNEYVVCPQPWFRNINEPNLLIPYGWKRFPALFW